MKGKGYIMRKGKIEYMKKGTIEQREKKDGKEGRI